MPRTPLLAITLLLLASPAASLADPAAPAGWRAEARTGLTRYVVADRGDVELRLHAAVASHQAPVDWFVDRRRRVPDGVALSGYSETGQKQGVHLAVGTGSRARTPVLVVALACRRGDAMIYGELIAPASLEALQAVMEPAIRVVVEACFLQRAAAVERPATKPAAERPATKPTKPSKADLFAYRTAPGKGLAASSIEAVVYSWRQVYRFTGLQLEEEAYLLLKGGAVRRGVPPVPAEDFDAVAERRAEPKLWGSWKKQGGDYLVSFAGERFAKPPGALVRQPGRSGERLNARYEGSSSVTIGDGAAWSKWTLTLGPDQRFSRTRSGGSGAGGVGDVVVGTAYDDEGSASSVTGPNVGGGSSRRSGSSKADREGTYRIDGYTLELRYDSGRVERRFFFTKADRSAIWFDDGEMFIRKK